MSKELAENANQKFSALLQDQLSRVEHLKQSVEAVDYAKLDKIIIGICPGDGIGPIICKHAWSVLEHVLKDEIASGKVVLKDIEGLTIENRIKHGKAIPDDVLEELKSCHVILKGPTTTPQAGDKRPNIESANVAMRRELDLFANVRPVRIPEQGIDWTFFRENTEGAYVLGSRGFDVGEDLSIDFKIITEQGAERIARMAFAYAKKNGIDRVTVVTKSNVIKTTDGRFSRVAFRVAKEYPEIKTDEWYIDIMTAKLLDPARRASFKVFLLPNLYGDILTDEAAQLQGGVGTAGSANIGTKWAMFEAVHGSAPRMVEEGREQYADPSSMIRAAAMLLRHINRVNDAERVEKALNACAQEGKAVTGRGGGLTGEEFTEEMMSRMDL